MLPSIEQVEQLIELIYQNRESNPALYKATINKAAAVRQRGKNKNLSIEVRNAKQLERIKKQQEKYAQKEIAFYESVEKRKLAEQKAKKLAEEEAERIRYNNLTPEEQKAEALAEHLRLTGGQVFPSFEEVMSQNVKL